MFLLEKQVCFSRLFICSVQWPNDFLNLIPTFGIILQLNFWKWEDLNIETEQFHLFW